MGNKPLAILTADLPHLRRCLELAREAFEAGDAPFGSVLVNDENEIIAESRNLANTTIATAHPEADLAKWALENLTADERKRTTMYTSGEHCPMCSAAHGWAGLGPIVYLASAAQLAEWRKSVDGPEPPIRFYPIQEIVPHLQVRGPGYGELLEEIKSLQLTYIRKSKT